jgi:tetratricopeptide (TPR) repeat protein
MYDQALEAMNAGNYRSAELIFRTVIENNDQYSERASFQLAKSILYQKKYKSAIYEFNRYLLLSTNEDTRSETRFWIGEAYYLGGNKLQAIEEYKRYLTQRLTNNALVVQAYRRIGYIYFTQLRYEEAIIEWEKALPRSGSEFLKNSIRYDIAVSRFLNRQQSQALSILREILKEEKDPVLRGQCSILIGRIYQSQNRHKKAIEQFDSIDKKLYVKAPLNESLYYSAISRMKLSNTDMAMEKLTLFIKYGAGSRLLPNAQIELARNYFERGEYERALRLCNSIIDNSENRTLYIRAVQTSVEIHNRKNNRRDALKSAENITKYDISYDTRDAYLMLVDAYIAQEMYIQAEELLVTLKEKLQYDPGLDTIQYKLSFVYLQQEKYEKAIQGYTQIEILNPFSEYKNESFYFIAAANYSSENYTEALRFIRQYLRFSNIENRYSAYLILLDIHLAMKNIRAANNTAEILIRDYSENPENAEVIYRCAAVDGQTQKVTERYINYIVNFFPDSPTAYPIYYMNGINALKRNDYQTSKQNFLKLIDGKQHTKFKNTYYNYIISFYRTENYTKVISEANTLPDSVEDAEKNAIILLAARSFVNLNRYLSATREYNRVNSSYYDPVDFYNQLTISLETNQFSTTQMIAKEQFGDYYTRSIRLTLNYFEKNGLYDAGHNFYDAHLQVEKQPEIVIAKASLYLYQGDFAELDLFLDQYQEYSSTEKIQLITLQSHIQQGRVDSASVLALKMESATPEYKTAMEELIVELHKTNKTASAVTLLSRYKDKISDKNLFAILMTARLQFSQRKYKDGAASYQRLLANEKSSVEALYYLGWYNQFIVRDLDRAESFYRRSSTREFDFEGYTSRSKLAYAKILLDKNSREKARAQIEDVQNNSPDRYYRLEARELYNKHFRGTDEY